MSILTEICACGHQLGDHLMRVSQYGEIGGSCKKCGCKRFEKDNMKQLQELPIMPALEYMSFIVTAFDECLSILDDQINYYAEQGWRIQFCQRMRDIQNEPSAIPYFIMMWRFKKKEA